MKIIIMKYNEENNGIGVIIIIIIISNMKNEIIVSK